MDTSHLEPLSEPAGVAGQTGQAGQAGQAESGEPAASLYETVVSNRGGTSGWVDVAGGMRLPTGLPEAGAAGANPEQFLGMAWSTCLNSAVAKVLAQRGLDPALHASTVTVTVRLFGEADGEFRFAPHAAVHVPGLPAEQVREVVTAAHARCPMSKLLTGRGTATVEALASDEVS